MTEFNEIKRKPNEEVPEFIKRFNKLYNNILAEMKPPRTGAKVVFAGTFESDFESTLREKRYPTLDQIQIDALKIEVNSSAAENIN